MIRSAAALSVQIFADGADKASMLALAADPLIKGFTTNPTLMAKAGVRDYLAFAREIVAAIPDRHISLEVFSDDFDEMERQARLLATLGPHVFVKIPVTNTAGAPSYALVERLSRDGIKVNITAIFTEAQVAAAIAALGGHAPACISIFAGRIADTGVDPVPMMKRACDAMRAHTNLACIWASPRELLNVIQAHEVGAHIITASPDVLKKLPLLGRDLDELSLEAVRIFREDAVKAGFSLPV